MSFPKIGLSAVLEDKAFNAAMDRYVSALQKMKTKTAQASDSVSSSSGRAASGLGGMFQQAMAFVSAQAIWAGIQKIGSAIRDLAGEAFEAVASYERLGMSLTTLYARELKQASGGTLSMADALALAGDKAKDLLNWIEQVGIKSPFSSEGVAQAFRTAMAYGFTADEAKRLTQANIDFAAGSGASSDVMNQIALALGQIKAKGKLAGQEMLQLTNAGLNVRQILADAFGVSTEAIVEMQEKGLIPANKAIEAIMQSLEEDFAGAAERQATSLSGLSESLKELKTIGLREFFTGTFQAIQPYLSKFVDLLGSPEVRETLNQWGSALGGAVAQGLEFLMGALAQLPALWAGVQSSVAPVLEMLSGVAQTVTGVVLPAIGDLLKAFKVLAGPGDSAAKSEWLDNFIKGTLLDLSNLASDMFAWVTKNLPLWLAKLAEMGQAAATWVLNALPALMGNLETLKQKLIGFVMDNLPVWAGELLKYGIAAVSWIADQLPALGAKLGEFYNRMVNWVVDSLPGWIAKLQEFGMNAIQWVLDALPGLATNLGKFAGELLKWVARTIVDVVPKLAELAFKFVGWVVTDVIPKLPEFLGKIVIGIISFIGGMISTISPELATFATDMVAELSSKITERTSEMVQAGKDLLQGFWDGIGEIWNKIVGWIQEKINGLPQIVKDVLGIHSPSTVMAEIGQEFIEGFLVGMDEEKVKLYSALAEMGSKIAGMVTDWGKALEVLRDYKAGPIGYLDNFVTNVKSIVSRLMAALAEVGGKQEVLDAFADRMKALAEVIGPTSAMAKAMMEFRSYTSGAMGYVHNFIVNLGGILDRLAAAFANYGPGWMVTTGAALNNAVPVMTAIKALADGVEAMRGYGQGAMGYVANFITNLKGILTRLGDAFKDYGPHWLTTTGVALNNAVPVMTAIKALADGVEAMRGYGSGAMGYVHNFIENLKGILTRLGAAFANYGPYWLTTTATALNNAVPVMTAIKALADGVEAMRAYKAGAIGYVHNFIENLQGILTRIGAVFGAYGPYWLSTIAAWFPNAQIIMSSISTFVEAFAAISEASLPKLDQITVFVQLMKDTLIAVADAFRDFGEYWLKNVAVIMERADTIYSTMKTALQTFGAVAEFGTEYLSPKKFEVLFDIMRFTLEGFAWMAYQIAPNVAIASAVAAQYFAAVWQSMSMGLAFLSALAESALPTKDKINDFVGLLQYILNKLGGALDISGNISDTWAQIAAKLGTAGIALPTYTMPNVNFPTTTIDWSGISGAPKLTGGGGGGGGGGGIESFGGGAMDQLFSVLSRAVTIPLVIAMESWAYPQAGGAAGANQYQLTIYSQARAEDLMSDFEMLRAMA